MNKFWLAASAASVLCASPALAATTVVTKDNTAATATPLVFSNDTAVATFAATYSVDNENFVDEFFFSLSQYATLSLGSLNTTAGGGSAPYKGDLDLSSVAVFSGTTNLVSFTGSMNPAGTDKNETFSLPAAAQPLLFAPGTYSVKITGFADNVSASSRNNGAGPGTYDGSVTFAAAAAPTIPAVPEPATWAFLILGFGAIGGALRNRTAQAAKVRAALV